MYLSLISKIDVLFAKVRTITSSLGGFISYIFLRQILRGHVVRDNEIATCESSSTNSRDSISLSSRY